MPTLELSQEHVYTLEGRVLPSVTQIADSLGISPHIDDSTYYLERGKAVHKAIALDLGGILDEGELDPVIRPRLDAARLFFAETEGEVIAYEVSEYHRRLLHAGTVDLVFERKDAVWVIDWKCGRGEKWHGFQTIGYQLLVDQKEFWASRGLRCPKKKPIRRAIVELRANGKPYFKEYSDPGEESIFVGAVQVEHWKRRVQR